ncbi:MAG: mechanosensitive ion channel family protein [Phycisphaerales bacterium JB043]
MRLAHPSRAHTVFALLTLLLVALPALAQDQPTESAPPPPPPGLSSPQETMFSFLEAVNEKDFVTAVNALELPPGTESGARNIAARLVGVINRIGFVTEDQLPDASQVERENLTSFVYFPQSDIIDHAIAVRDGAQGQIALTRSPDGAWRFSRATIANLDALYTSVESFSRKAGVDEAELDYTIRIHRMMPQQLRSQIMGLFGWQWLGLLALIFIAVVIDLAVQLFLRGFATRRIRKRGQEAEPDEIKRSMRPFGLFAASLFMIASIWALALPAEALRIVIPAIRLVMSVASVWAAFRTVDLISSVAASRAKLTASRYDDLLIPLVRKTLKIFIFAIGLIYIAGALNIEIVPLLTGLGIGGLAVAFAAKDTIENFFGSVAVIMDHPFQVGDWVVVEGVEGIVEELGFRSTRIRTFYNSQVTIPNATLVRATVDNYGRRKYRRFKTALNVTYDTPPDTIEAFCEGVRELIRLHPYTRKDYYCVYFNNMGAHSLDILVYTFFEAPDWQTELRERQRFLLDVLRLAKQLGVEFAFPTQTLWVNPEDDGSPPPQAPASDASEQAQKLGRDTAQTIISDQPWVEAKPAPEAIIFSSFDRKGRKTEAARGGGSGEGEG